MHQPEVLPKMILSVEGSRFDAFLFAAAVVVDRQMLIGGFKFVAIDTLALTGGLVDDDLTKGCADPFL